MTGSSEHAGDVALAHAAAAGDPAAQAELHSRVVRAAHATLPAAGYADHIVDDTIGELVLTLLGEPNKPSPLLTYRGESSLSAWLRTLVVRTAMRLAQACRRETPTFDSDDTSLFDRVATSDLTRDLYRAELRAAVRRAFAVAIARLSYFDHELLASFIVAGHSVDDIAKTHAVHRATAARWLARARAALDRELCKELERDLRASDSEVASILQSVQSSIDLSVARLLAR
jgi:RNA polymerase sigma-70 factor, ECF subfamily